MEFIPVSKPYLKKEELNNVKECVETNWISSKGEFVNKFENLFSDYCDMDYGVATANGTVALHLALEALNVQKGDEVIIPDLTFAATINSVLYTNAIPVIVDIDEKSWTIDPKKIKENITDKTKAIIPVHIYGQPCNMEEIVSIARENNLYIIEDCAEAHGAEYKGNKVGSFGDISCFSFYSNKIITTGEGGMCLTNNKKLYEKMQILRDHGMNPDKRYWHNEIGYNYRMTNLQAAVGVAQMNRINIVLNKRKRLEKEYNKKFSNVKGLEIQNDLTNRKKVCWMYSLLIDKNKFGISRNKLISFLKQNNVDSRPFFYPLHSMDIYKKYLSDHEDYKISKMISGKGINLPTIISENEKKEDKIIKRVSAKLLNCN